MLKYILFDLDGTMLPMDQDKFIKIYFTELSNRFCPIFKLEDEQLIKAVWKATNSMVKNDGSRPNRLAFWETFSKILGNGVLKYVKDFDDFYMNEFNECKAATKFNPLVPEIIKTLKNKGYTLIAATNPLFPEAAIKNRMGWAGVKPGDFELVASYENFSTSKPNPKYFSEIAEKIKAEAEQCLMVGNDIDEDILPSAQVGMDAYVLTDCLVNRSDADYSEYKHGSMRELLNYARMLPDVKIQEF